MLQMEEEQKEGVIDMSNVFPKVQRGTHRERTSLSGLE